MTHAGVIILNDLAAAAITAAASAAAFTIAWRRATRRRGR